MTHCDTTSRKTARTALAVALLCLAPAVASAQFASDDFNACTLDTVWTFVNPDGDFDDPIMVGTHTDDARLSMTVPSGQIYQFWNGTNEPPYIIQDAADTDMTVEVKFDSHLQPLYLATEGIIVREDSGSWVRAEFYTRPDSLYRVSVGVGLTTTVHDVTLPADVTAPITMRLERSGDTWTQSWRDDGNYTSWTVAGAPFVYAMNVTGVGIYVGNNNLMPSHTIEVDYFSHMPGPPAGEDTARAPLDVTVVGGGSVTKTPDQTTYGCDEQVTLSAILAPGWAFAGWSGDLVSTDNPASITMNGPAAVTATFVPATTWDLDLTLVGGGSVTLDPPGGIYEDGTVVTLTAVEPAGWGFNGWSGDLSGANLVETILMDGDKAVTATFSTLAQYTLNVGTVGPGVVNADPAPEPGGFYFEGTAVELTAVPDPGWQLDAWSGDLTGAANPDTVVMDAARSVTATFTETPPPFVADDFNACALDPVWTFPDPGDAFDDPIMVGTYTDAAAVSITCPSGQIYQFWNGTNEPPHILQPAADTDLTVEVKFQSHLPALYLATEGIVVKEDASSWVRAEFYTRQDGLYRVAVDVGLMTTVHDITLPADVTAPITMRLERSGDTWTQSWRDDGNYTSWTVANTPFVYAMNVTGVGVYAGNNNQMPTHTVEIDYVNYLPGPPLDEDVDRAPLDVTVVGGGGLVSVTKSPDLATYGCGEQVTLTAVEAVGWVFDSWSGDLATTDNPATITMDGAAAVTATFVPAVTHAVDVTLVGGGGSVSLSPPGGVYNAGTVVTLTADDAPGWAFSDWSGDLVSAANPDSVVVDGDKNVTATFTATSQYALTVDDAPPGSGTVTLDPPGGVYNAGTSVVLTAVPGAGWLFDAWSGDLTGPANPDTIVMDAAKTVTAGFIPLVEHTLTLAEIGDGTVTAVPAPGPGGTYYEGTLVELTAVPDPGWELTSWSGDLVGSANPDTVLIDADRAVTATFGLIPPAIDDDDFNACDLDPMWTFDDPLADGGAYAMTGSYSGDASVALSVAAGPAKHQLFNGAITAPHILQPATDHDVTAEVGFGSVLPPGYTQEGMFFFQDAGEFVGFEFYTNPSGQPHAYIRLPDDTIVHNLPVGAPGDTLAMRVVRTGDSWTQWWSNDGHTFQQVGGSFTHALAVTGFGVFAGNTGSVPVAHTVLVDYVSNEPGAPPAEDATLNELTIDLVGSGTVLRSPDQPTYGCDETVVLTAVPDPGWAFEGWSGALTGTANPDSVTMSGSTSATATFIALETNVIAADTGGAGCLSQADPCAEGVPVVITRDEFTGMRFFSVTFGLTNLALCDSVSSIVEGDYLSAVGATQFQVVDHLDGTWTVDGTIVGEPCGAADSTGTLFTLDVESTIPDGMGTIEVTAVTLTACDGSLLPGAPGAPATLMIDGTGPAIVVADLAVRPLTVDNPADGVMSTDLSWTPVVDPDVDGLRLWRKSYGAYPEYDDAGTAPVQPADPGAEGWELVAALPAAAVGYRDSTASRDAWSYVAVAVDSCGNASAPSTMTPSTLNYVLGDVAGHPTSAWAGDNAVDIEDVDALELRYGSAAGDGSGIYRPELDIGPTDDDGPDGVPLTDDMIEFEDLMVMAMTFGTDVGPVGGPGPVVWTSPDPAPANLLNLMTPPPPPTGQLYQVTLGMAGDGTIHGLSVPLTWDPAVVEPIGLQTGDLLDHQTGPYLTLRPDPGTADAALLGPRDGGISGDGVLVEFVFRVLAPGDPAIALGTIRARDEANQPVPLDGDVTTGIDDLPGPPTVTALHRAAPNPFNPSTKIAFDLAREGRVRVKIYGVDGRLVRTLVDGVFQPGRYAKTWNGKDDRGRGAASGTYIARMETADGVRTRRMVLLK